MDLEDPLEQPPQKVDTKVQLTCNSNIDRINKGPDNWRSLVNLASQGEPAVFYLDSDFPAERTSLYWDGHLRDDSENVARRYKEKVTGWKRPGEIARNVSLWGFDGVKPDAVQQGRLGDEWFLSAATALAEYPDRVKKLFMLDEYPKEGIFATQLYVKGEPIIQTIDDRLPVLENDTPVNARPSPQGAWWLVLLEKAYAKLNLNYANLDGGMQYEAMRALTGQPVVVFATKKQSEKEIWETIADSDEHRYILTASCLRDYQGLIGGHAYTILGILELRKDDGGVEE